MNDPDSTKIDLSVSTPASQVTIVEVEVRTGETAVWVSKHGRAWCSWTRPRGGSIHPPRSPISETEADHYDRAITLAMGYTHQRETARLLHEQLDHMLSPPASGEEP